MPAGFFRYSSHLFGGAEALQTARVPVGLPPFLVIFAIEAADFSYGDQLTSAVTAMIDQGVQQVAAELNLDHRPLSGNRQCFGRQFRVRL